MQAGLKNLLENVRSSTDRADPLGRSLMAGLGLFAVVLLAIGWVSL